MDGWEKRRSWSRSVEKAKKDKEKKKKRKHDTSRDRSRSHKKKKKHASPEKEQKARSPELQKKQAEKVQKMDEEKNVPDEREKSEKKKKRKDSRERDDKKHKKKKDKKQRRSESYDSRERSRNKKKKKDYRDDRDDRYYRKDRDDYRRDRRKRHSSHSEEDEVKENPEQLEKLSQLKAAKQLVSSKADRKLYLGNLPPNITSQQLMEMLNSALKKMDINTDVEGDSIVSAWISPDGVGHYAFVQFRTAQEATNGLTLNGASLYGYQLKLGRPKQYIEYNKALLSDIGTDKNLQTILKKVSSLGKEELPPIEERIICPPSKIIVLKHIVSIEELGIDEEYEEIYEDVLEMAKRFGEVVKLMIPRPHQTINLQLAPTRVKGLGLILIEYKSVSEAKYARNKFLEKEFSGRPVAVSFFDEKQYRAGQYDIQDKVIIDF